MGIYKKSSYYKGQIENRDLVKAYLKIIILIFELCIRSLSRPTITMLASKVNCIQIIV